jgi:cell division protein FtsB
MTANDGEGTVWIGQEAVSAGIANEVLDQVKVAARMELRNSIVNKKQPAMGKMKVKAKLVGAWDTVTALVAGKEVEVEIDATAEQVASQEALAQATADRIAAEAKAKELADGEEALKAKLAEAEAAKTTAEATATEVSAKLESVTSGITAKLTDAEKTITNLQRELAKALDMPAGSPPIEVNDSGIVSPLRAPGKGTPDAGAQLANEVYAMMTPLERSIAANNKKKREAAQGK